MVENEAALIKGSWNEFQFLPPDSALSSSSSSSFKRFPSPSVNDTSGSLFAAENVTQNDVIFNFSWSVAYEIIQKYRKTRILFPETEVVLIVIYALLMSSGILSNVLVCFVVMRQCVRKKTDIGSSAPNSRNLYVVNLAVADLALCCICMPFTLVTLVRYEWTFGSLLCKLVPVVQGTNIMVSAGTITAIAFDRYITIVRPPGSRVLHDHACCNVAAVIAIIWLFGFSVTSPVFFYTVVEPVSFYDVLLYEKCIERWPSSLAYTVFTVSFAIVQFVIPGLALATIHLRISAYLKLHLRRPEIEIHSPTDGTKGSGARRGGGGDEEEEEEEEEDDDERRCDASSRKEFLGVRRKESVASDNSQRSCDSARKSSDCSRKFSDGSRNNSECCDGGGKRSGPKKRSDFLFRDAPSDVSGFSFHRFPSVSRKCRHDRRKRARRELRRNRRTMFVLSCIAVVYAVSWLPMTVFQVLATQIPQAKQNPKVVYVAFAACHILAMSTAVTNPLLYGWLNTNFRREFSVVFASIAAFFSKIFKTEVPAAKARAKLDGLRAKPPQPPPPGVAPDPHVPRQLPRISLTYVNGKLNSTTVTIVSSVAHMQL